MTRTEIVAVAIRLLAVWFFVQAASLVVAAIAARHSSGDWSPVIQLMVQLVLLSLACALTWKFSIVLAKKALPAIDPAEPVVPLSSRDIERVALRVLGVFLIVTGMSGLGQAVMYARIIAETTGQGTWIAHLGQADPAGWFVRSAIQIVAGAILYVGRTGLRRALAVVRGEDDAESSPSSEPGPPSDERAE